MYSHIYNYEDLNRQTNKLINDIEKAINGEYSAIMCYESLAKIAPSEKERKQILEIQSDEKKHLQQFIQLYYSLTGVQPQPKMTEECAENYIEGLQLALKDEQETVDFYLGISDETSNVYTKELLKRIAMDEQNHAVWFLYFYTKLK
ncbi:ferritin-like domain-containing protein [Bacillus massiliigorillae]|uniref:ferritin-like domain-containing protein n=1 Tax=Bacillus massiliigorillae TaxID=1243664 RepID=UPI0003A5310A|nr:ferritin-like domain-containing protein [Bacillus massiliigorillae]